MFSILLKSFSNNQTLTVSFYLQMFPQQTTKNIPFQAICLTFDTQTRENFENGDMVAQNEKCLNFPQCFLPLLKSYFKVKTFSSYLLMFSKQSTLKIYHIRQRDNCPLIANVESDCLVCHEDELSLSHIQRLSDTSAAKHIFAFIYSFLYVGKS